MISALKKRALADGDETADALEYVIDWTASGNTLVKLSKELKCSRAMLAEWANSAAPDSKERLRRAREDGGHAMVEEAEAIADETPAERDNIALSKLRIDTKLRVAETWNNGIGGSNKQGGITVNIGTLMLEALRQPAPAIAQLAPADPTAIAGAIESEAEVLSVEAPTS